MRNYVVTILLLTTACVFSLKFFEKKSYHIPKIFSNNDIAYIARLYDETYFNHTLSQILVPRTVGSENHHNVRKFIHQELQRLGWTVEDHSFQAVAPKYGLMNFTNIVALLNPNATRHLALACHYDSKIMPHRFDAATDSAVPCAMMLQIAHSLKSILSQKNNSDLSLKMIFFDGEEAFVEWTDTDSLYGSRALASHWHKTPFPDANDSTNKLHSLDILVLLDLLGAKNPKFYSFFRDTQRWHSVLTSAERKLKALGQISPRLPLHFLEKSTYSFVQDDHVPFLQLGVPVLHVIPIPFPKEWHTADDNEEILDFPTISTLCKVLQIFVLAYLDGSIPPSLTRS